MDPDPHIHTTRCINYTEHVEAEDHGIGRKLKFGYVNNRNGNCSYILGRELWLPTHRPYNMLSKLHKTCGSGSPRKFKEADGIWRKLKFGYESLRTTILAQYRAKNCGHRPPPYNMSSKLQKSCGDGCQRKFT